MAISKQQEAVIAKIVSYDPATWFLACESEVVKIPEEDRAEFGKILLEAMDVYKSKVQNVIQILKRGPNLDPEVNIRAWAMMHARFLARLFIKHPTLCERLCIKLSNEAYKPGWRRHVKKFKDIEEHKEEVEEQVEAACRESQLFFSTHSGYDFVITNHSNSTCGSQSRVQNLSRFEAQSRKTAAQSLLALSQSDQTRHGYGSTSSSQLPPSQVIPLQLNSGHDQTTTSNSKSHDGEKQPKHLRFALALEKSVAAELEAISKMNGNSSYHNPQEKAYQLYLERNLQAQIASQNDNLYGVSDDERDRSTRATKLNNGKRVAISSSSHRISATEPAVILDSDIEGEGQLTPRKSVVEAITGESRQEDGSRQILLLSSIQESTLNKAATPHRSLGTEYETRNKTSSPAEPVDGDNDERFSLREMIDAMEFVAEHPWVCEHLLVDHVWDEYKLFHEYNMEALKVAEEEVEEPNRAAAEREITPSPQKETDVGSLTASVHRTRSTSQTSHLPNLPPSRAVSPPLSTLSVCQTGSNDEANANKMTAAEEEQAITAAAKAGFVNRNFQLQVATVYRALGVVPTAAGPVPSNHAPLNRTQSSENSISTNNTPLLRGRPFDRSVSGHSRSKRCSRPSKVRYEAADPVVDDDTIIVDTSSSVPAHVYSVPDHIAPPRRGRSSEKLVPTYAPPKRRHQSIVGQENAAHGTDAKPSTSPDRAKKTLAPPVSRAQMREKLQVAAVYQSLGCQNEMYFGNFGNDGARVEMEEVQEFPAETHNLRPGRTRRGRDAGLYKVHHDRRVPSFGLQSNVPETFAQDRSLSMHGGVGEPSDFGSKSYVNQNMDFGIGLAPRRSEATTAGQDQEGFAINQTLTEQEMGFAGVAFSVHGNRSLNQQVSGNYGLSQPTAALDSLQQDFWINRGKFDGFEPIGMALDMGANMDLDAGLFPAPYPNYIPGSGNHPANFSGNYNSSIDVENMPLPGPRRSSHHLGAFSPDASFSGFGGMKQPFGTVNQATGGMNQAPVGFEGMDEFAFYNTPLTRINAGFGFGNMDQSFDEPGRMDSVDVTEIPLRERASTRNRPGEIVAPVTPNRTRASTRSQRRYDLSARGDDYFRFQDTESIDGKDGDDYDDGEDGEDGEDEEEDNDAEIGEDGDDEDDFEEESPSKRARHRKHSSRNSGRTPTRGPSKGSAKGSAKGTPRRSRNTPVKKGPKVAFAPRPASAPSTLDRGPPRRYHQTKINLSPGAFGTKLSLEVSGLQGRLPFTTVAQDRAEFKKEFEMDPEDPDL
ncbi:hypothetical protein EAE96_002849 [Botrytis aclada]|nr:hypothetical protein EAE96_002849 [Botrytis aclada]